jgi:hypothetical protein
MQQLNQRQQTSSLAQLPLISSSPSLLATKGIEGTRGVGVKAPSLQQIQSTSDSFKNNNNKTLQIISAAVTPILGGIRQSMTGMVKNTGKNTLRFLTITAQILDSNHKVIGDVIAIAKNSNLVPGQQTSFSGIGSVSEGTKPVYFKLTFEWL